jgi:hypothetical protein
MATWQSKGGDVQVALAVTQSLDTDGHGWRSGGKRAATNSSRRSRLSDPDTLVQYGDTHTPSFSVAVVLVRVPKLRSIVRAVARSLRRGRGRRCYNLHDRCEETP